MRPNRSTCPAVSRSSPAARGASAWRSPKASSAPAPASSITGRDQGHLDAARGTLSAGERPRARGTSAADVGKQTDAAARGDGRRSAFGGLDVLVNNAGVGLFANVADMAAAAWQQVIDTNLSGVFYCCRAAIPAMRQRGGGWIVNISSLAGKNPFVRARPTARRRPG